MRPIIKFLTISLAASFLPLHLLAQSGTGLAAHINGLQGVLDQLYQSLLPQCSMLIGVAQAIGGFAALWFIGYRVWRHIHHAQPVDMFPLFRPFAIGIAILFFPSLIALMNGILQPTVDGTAKMQTQANQSIAILIQQREDALKNGSTTPVAGALPDQLDPATWDSYAGTTDSSRSGLTASLHLALEKMRFSLKTKIRQWISEILELLYEAAALCIDTLRIFQLLVMAILGPLVLGFSIFDGFQGILNAWISRYVSIFLWLPVANIFGAIISNVQVQMLQLDISQLQSAGETSFSPTNAGYIIFLIIGISGYLQVPAVAGYIVNIGAHNPIGAKIMSYATNSVQQVFRGDPKK